MPRLLFEKTGNAVWISHLDLMRLFQRSFKRAGLDLKHSQGFNPRPYVAVALPLSVGVESTCELLDFDLEGASVPGELVMDRLNRTLTGGVRVLEVYGEGAKIRDLAYLDCTVTLEYDRGVPSGAVEAVRELFCREALMLEKKGKNGPTQQDLIPLIRGLSVEERRGVLLLQARICCQNPSLNPMQLAAAVSHYLPDFTPDHVRCRRNEIYGQNEEVFR